MSFRTPTLTRIVAPSEREYTGAFQEDAVPHFVLPQSVSNAAPRKPSKREYTTTFEEEGMPPFVLPQSLYSAAPKKASKRQRGGAARHRYGTSAKARRNAVPGLDVLLSTRR